MTKKKKKIPIIIGVTGSKGGIAKTTTSVSVADGLVRFHGQKVLLVEADAQSSCCLHLGLRGQFAERKGITLPEVGLGDFLRGDPLSECITPINDGLDLLAGGPDAKSEIQKRAGNKGNTAVSLFRDAIASSDYDVVIIDAPPGIGSVTAFIWMASDYVVLPFKPNDVESLDAMRTIFRHLEDIREATGICPGIMGAVATIVDRRTLQGRKNFPIYQAYYEKQNLYLGHCPYDSKTSSAIIVGETIFQHAPTSRAAKYYKEITAEIFSRIKAARRDAEKGVGDE